MKNLRYKSSRPTRTSSTDLENARMPPGIEPPGMLANFLNACAVIAIAATFPISLFFCIRIVKEFERAVIFRLGRLIPQGSKGPGLFFYNFLTEVLCIMDMRVVSYDVPPQEILSRDSVTVSVDAVVFYRIASATNAVNNVENCARSTHLLAATILRNVLGTKDLSQILSERTAIATSMQLSLDEATHAWGIKVERVEIKDVRLPVALQRAMAAEAEATREANAKVIAAQGEQRSARALQEAGEVMAKAPAALQLRYLQALSTIAAERNSTIVFPLPMEILRGFLVQK